KVRHVELAQQSAVEQRLPVEVPTRYRCQPGEGRGLDRRGGMEPAIAPEYLVGAFAGQGNGRVPAHLLEQPVERWPHAAPVGRRPVERPYDLAATCRVGELVTVEDDLVVAGAYALDQVPHEGRTGRAAHRVAGKAVAMIAEVDREGADVAIAAGEQFAGGQGRDDRRVEAAG